jgi:hypothetical protein
MSDNHPTTALVVRPKKAARTLATIAAALILISTAGQVIKFATGHDTVFGFVPKFYVDNDVSVPNYFSSVMLLLSSALLGLIAKFKNRRRDAFARHWICLAVIFLFLSIDETVGFHESFVGRLRESFHATGIFYFAWVIPAIPLVLIFALSYLKFLVQLPGRTRYRIALSGMVYVGGALGMELLGGWYYQLYRGSGIGYAILVTVEETLEMSGLVLFIFALFDYIATELKEVRFQFTREESQ